jgi:hypothetical protein
VIGSHDVVSDLSSLVDSAKLLEYVRSVNPQTAVKTLSDSPAMLPCEVLHPQCDSCSKNGLGVFADVAKKISPVYGNFSLLFFIIVNNTVFSIYLFLIL